MAWGDPASGISTTTAELQYVLPIYYRKRILELINQPAGLWDTLDREMFPQRSGTTVTFMKYARLNGITTIDGGALTQGENPTSTDLVTGQVTAAIVEYGGIATVADLAALTVIDGAEKVSQVVAAWAKEAMEYYSQITFTPYLKQVRADGDSTYEVNSVTTSAGSTTLINDTTRTEANDFWIGALVTIIDSHSGAYGESQYCSDSVQNTSITVGTAFSQTIGDAVNYHISIPTGILATDVLTLSALRLAQKELRKYGAMGSAFEIPGGGYNGVYDADLEAQILADTQLLELFTHTEKEAGGIRGYTPGKLMMIQPIFSGVPFRTAVTGAGTYASGGICHYMSIFGQQAGAVMPLQQNDIQIIAKGKQEIGGPLERFSTTGWKVQLAIGKMDMNAGVALICGA